MVKIEPGFEDIVFLAHPVYGGIANEGACLNDGAIIRNTKTIVVSCDTSALPHCFNKLWCYALNFRGKFRWFIMRHADIQPVGNYIKQLVDEIKRMQTLGRCDVISVVSPIKGDSGDTSVGVIENKDKWNIKRKSLKEIQAYPETFKFPGMLANTGLMIVDFSQPWVEKICFKFEDRIIAVPESSGGIEYKPQFWPEDWDFTLQAQKLGAEVYCNRTIKLNHIGSKNYANQLEVKA